MKRILILAGLSVFIVLFNAFIPGNITLVRNSQEDSLSQDRLKRVNEVNEMIKGRENENAEAVYKNLQYIKGFKAGLLPLIMNKWSIALGVSCGHCHENGSWELDTKPEKEIARKMAGLSPVISDYLKTIKELKNPNPIVNCATCHRGQLKPALDVKSGG
jgi:hypothetical protein